MPEWAIGLLGFLAGILAIRVVFDVNRWREQNRERDERKLKALCPHVEMVPLEDRRIEVRSFFTSPPGTVLYYCSQCGLEADELGTDRVTRWWMEQGLNRYIKDYAAFVKHAKRMGIIS